MVGWLEPSEMGEGGKAMKTTIFAGAAAVAFGYYAAPYLLGMWLLVYG